MEPPSEDVLLETPRMSLRPWVEDDAEAHFAIYGTWDVAQWLGANPRAVASVSESRERIRGWESRRVNPFGLWAMVLRDRSGMTEPSPVGSVLLVPLSDGLGQPAPETEIGWHLHPDHWGHGLATEAATCMLERAWRWGLNDVWAVVRPDNHRSMAVAERLGMQPRGRTSRWYGVELESFQILRPRGDLTPA